jgi:hypothetical protein
MELEASIQHQPKGLHVFLQQNEHCPIIQINFKKLVDEFLEGYDHYLEKYCRGIL